MCVHDWLRPLACDVTSLTLRHIPNPLLLCPLWEANHHAFGASLALWYISRRHVGQLASLSDLIRRASVLLALCNL